MDTTAQDTAPMTEADFQRVVIAILVRLLEDAGYNPNLERLAAVTRPPRAEQSGP